MTPNEPSLPARQTIMIGDRPVGLDHSPFMVAEVSANHGGDFDRALKIIRAAADAGADAVKFQAYTAESLTLNLDLPEFRVKGDNPWAGRKLYDLYKEAATPYEWFPDLFAACKDVGVVPFASPFDQAAIDMLQDLDAPAYKIASFEAVDLNLIAACAKTGKPLIISVGLCNELEIEDAVAAARSAGSKDIILLQCNSAYPSQENDANLTTIPYLSQRFGVITGYSDHTLGALSSAAACALGACVIEKHIIDAVKPETADSAFSLTPAALEAVVKGCRAAWRSRGSVRQRPTDSETGNLAFRRSLYVVDDMLAGDVFTLTSLRSIRPGHGLPPKHFDKILGCRCTRDISKGEALDWSMISGVAEE